MGQAEQHFFHSPKRQLAFLAFWPFSAFQNKSANLFHILYANTQLLKRMPINGLDSSKTQQDRSRNGKVFLLNTLKHPTRQPTTQPVSLGASAPKAMG